jgi:tetratricopeptide (TPR) repeat protein
LVLVLAGAAAALAASGPTPTPTPTPEPVEQLVLRATERFRARDFAQAATFFRQAVDLDSKNVAAREGLVRALLKSHAIDEAVEKARGYAASEASDWSFALLGDALYRSGQFDEAGVAYTSSLAAGQSAHAHLGLYRLLRSNADRKSASQHLLKAYELAPDDLDVLFAWIERHWVDEDGIQTLPELCEKYLAMARIQDPSRSRVVTAMQALERTGGGKHWRLEGGVRSITIPLEQDGGSARHGLLRRTYINARVNGGRPLRLLLDTGAGGITLKSRVAKKCGVSLIGKVALSGIGSGGPAEASMALADSVSIGTLTFRNANLLVSDAMPSQFDGILGPNVFEEFLVRIDFPRSVLHLGPLPSLDGVTDPDDWSSFDRQASAETASYTQIRIFGSRLVVPTLVNGATRSHFLLDSGAFDNLISLQLASRLGRVGSAGDARVWGMSGAVAEVRRLGKVTLQVGRFSQSNSAVLAFDTPELDDESGYRMGGLIGNPVLNQLVITIDYRDSLVDFALP